MTNSKLNITFFRTFSEYGSGIIYLVLDKTENENDSFICHGSRKIGVADGCPIWYISSTGYTEVMPSCAMYDKQYISEAIGKRQFMRKNNIDLDNVMFFKDERAYWFVDKELVKKNLKSEYNVHSL